MNDQHLHNNSNTGRKLKADPYLQDQSTHTSFPRSKIIDTTIHTKIA